VRLPSRRVRRLLLPLEAAVLVGADAAFTVGALFGALFAPLDARRRILRTTAFGAAYCTVELITIARAGGLWLRWSVPGPWRTGSQARWVADNQALLGWALGRVLGAAGRCMGFEVVLDDAAEPAQLTGTEPVLVLARHGGPGDSFALVHMLLTRYDRRVFIVLKEILQLDPVLDVLLNRLGSYFLPSKAAPGEVLAERLAELTRQLGNGDALLIFPEGGNWTPTRRRRSIRHLLATHGPAAARTATLLTNVLPPRPAGVLACIDARPDIAIVVVAHAGLDRIVTARQAWDQLPLSTPMTVRAWPAAPVPTGEDARMAWLTTEWATVDEWVEAHHDR
jgi:1-acyl-sn-glycerol-3-phosphate acyltransferase